MVAVGGWACSLPHSATSLSVFRFMRRERFENSRMSSSSSQLSCWAAVVLGGDGSANFDVGPEILLEGVKEEPVKCSLAVTTALYRMWESKVTQGQSGYARNLVGDDQRVWSGQTPLATSCLPTHCHRCQALAAIRSHM